MRRTRGEGQSVVGALKSCSNGNCFVKIAKLSAMGSLSDNQGC